MATVKIKSIKSQNILSKRKYEYLLKRLNVDLPVFSLTYSRDQHLYSISIYTSDDLITVFPDTNGLDYEVKL